LNVLIVENLEKLKFNGSASKKEGEMVLTTHSTSVWIKSKGGMTQQELSELTGTPQSHISEIENGRRQIGKKRAKILGN